MTADPFLPCGFVWEWWMGDVIIGAYFDGVASLLECDDWGEIEVVTIQYAGYVYTIHI